jgi:hypothetical protein
VTEQIIIEFISDAAGLQPAEDRLAALGKIDQQVANAFKQTTAELNKRGQAVSNTATKTAVESKKTQSTIKDLDRSMKSMVDNFVKGFQEGVIAEIKRYKEQLKETGAETNKTTTSQKSLGQELKALTEQMAQLKLQGKENTEQYRILREQAGQYRDALGDVSAEINKTASDTRKLDTVIEFGQGIAASFAIAQGAAALFGEENEDLQEVLVRVTSALAILNGLQTVGNLIQKESNIMRAISNTQLKLSVIATNLETAAQSKNIVVKGAATVAMRVLNTVMKANPAFLLISAFAALSAALAFFGSRSRKTADEVAILNARLEEQNRILEGNIARLDFQGEKRIAELRKQGATEQRIQGETLLQLIRIQREYSNQVNNTQRLLETVEGQHFRQLKNSEDVSKRIFEIDARIAEGPSKTETKFLETRKTLLNQLLQDFRKYEESQRNLVLANVEFTADQAEKQRQKEKEDADKRLKEQEKFNEEQKKLRRKGFEDFVAYVEAQLLAAEKGSAEELELQKKLLKAKLHLDLDNEDLTENQRLLLVKKFFKEREDLERESQKELTKVRIEGIISSLNAELQTLNLTAQERERLSVDLLNRQRELELSQVEGNKEKEKEINAKFDREIADQRLQIRQQSLERELRIIQAIGGANVRKLSKTADDPQIDIKERIAAIDELERIELESIRKRRDANKKALDDNIISAEAYELTQAELSDQEAQAVENSEERKRRAYEETTAKRKEQFDQAFQQSVEIASQTAQVISAIFENMAAVEGINIQRQKAEIEDLRKAGAITEQESIKRLKRVEDEERRIRIEQAKREKALAIFNTIINTAQAVVKAFATTGPIAGPVFAGIIGALGAAQIALIASRPIPRFFKGKKGMYEGPGEVGDRGAELIEQNGRLWVADKPQVIWLGKKDVVYTHEETKRILEKPLPTVDRRVLGYKNGQATAKMTIDYERIGKEVGKHVVNNHLSITEKGIAETAKQGNAFTEYLDKRRRF